MKQDKQDRRSQRTRQLVNSALLELLAEKGYEAVTVQDILDRAGIGRSTFYSHYFDKEDVHTSLMTEMLEKMNRQLSERHAEQEILPSLEIFQHIYQELPHFQAVAGSGPGAERLWETMQVALNKIVEQALATIHAGKRQPAIPLPVMSSYLAGAFLNLLKWWMKADMPYSPEEMDRFFRQLALPGMWETLKGKNA